ncbi:hypothetical protein RchiOBHm_Chr1g0359681 [Rosa chinensis]|uniref:Uncharacterized protein n=1 Tax=Rosa chinensis TaxID=74649 RepID=A0A2P6SIF0_ROSCH|nr:hypothetical protein RchiOBHm_Chr1g0359681 [Rosa chinensis]
MENLQIGLWRLICRSWFRYYEGQFAPISEIDVEEVEAPAISVVEATKKS